MQKNKTNIDEEVRKSHKISAARRRDSETGAPEYKINDLVLLKKNLMSIADEKVIYKFQLIYDGPFRVTSLPYPNTCRIAHLEDGAIKGVYNIKSLKPYYMFQDQSTNEMQADNIESAKMTPTKEVETKKMANTLKEIQSMYKDTNSTTIRRFVARMVSNKAKSKRSGVRIRPWKRVCNKETNNENKQPPSNEVNTVQKELSPANPKTAAVEGLDVLEVVVWKPSTETETSERPPTPQPRVRRRRDGNQGRGIEARRRERKRRSWAKKNKASKKEGDQELVK